MKGERSSVIIGIRVHPNMKELLQGTAKIRGQTFSTFLLELIRTGWNIIVKHPKFGSEGAEEQGIYDDVKRAEEERKPGPIKKTGEEAIKIMPPESLQGRVSAKKRKLSIGDLLFIKEYLKDFNAVKAYMRCGHSEKSAYANATRMMEKDGIKEEIKRRLKISELPSLAELSRLMYSDARNLFHKNGTLKSPSEWDDQTASSVASLEVEETYTGTGKNRVWTGYLKKVKLWNKSQSLENMLKHLRLLNEKDEAAGDRGRPDLSGVSDGDLQRRLVLIICRITGRPVPEEIQVEGRPVDSPVGEITDGGTTQTTIGGAPPKSLLDEMLEKQKKEKGTEVSR